MKCAKGIETMVPIFSIPANERWYNAATLERIPANQADPVAGIVLLKVVHSMDDVVVGELLFAPNSTKGKLSAK